MCCIQSGAGPLVNKINNIFDLCNFVLRNFQNNFTSTFCLVDKELSCVVVSVYNLAQGRGPIIGDSVAIPEPYLTHIDAKYINQVCFFLNLINKIKN